MRRRVHTGDAMPRHSKHALFPIALSPAALAQSLGVAPSVVYEAVRKGELKIYQRGLARRVLVLDACLWVEKYWDDVTGKPKRKSQHTEECPR